MTGDLRIAEVNHDAITQNYVNFLRDQDEFKDLDFEGSAIRRIISLLAYDMHYSAYYANSAFKEHFLDSAVLRSSIVSHAKKFGYVPRSTKASTALVDVRLENGSSILNQNIELPKGTLFRGSLADGSHAFDFVTTKGYNIFADSADITFENVELIQGSYTSFNHRIDVLAPNQTISLPSVDIDISTLEVYVQEGSDISRLRTYTNGRGILTSPQGRHYWLEEGATGKFQIYFGDDIIGRRVGNGKIVRCVFVRTKAGEANNVSKFTYSSSSAQFQIYLASVFSSLKVATLSRAAGGEGPETTREIKYRAGRYNGNGRNALRTADYEERILDSFPEILSVKVWDASSLVDPAGSIGRVFISAVPRSGTFFTLARKSFILNEIRNNIAGATKNFEFVDPSFIYPQIRSKITPLFDSLSSAELLKDRVKNAILRYNDIELGRHNADIERSDLSTAITEADDGIDNAIIEIDLELRIIPRLRTPFGIVRTFGNAVFEATVSSTRFEIEGRRGYLIDNGSGKMLFTRDDDTTEEAGVINYATGNMEIFPVSITRSGDRSSTIKITARSKNVNIISRAENILRIEEENIFTTIEPLVRQISRRF